MEPGSKTTDGTDPNYDLAISMVKKVVQKLTEKVMELNGIHPAFRGPGVQLYTEYGKQAMELYLSQKKYEPRWQELRELQRLVEKHMKDVRSKIEASPVPALPNPLVVLFTSLVDPRVAGLFAAGGVSLQTEVDNVIEILDGQISGERELLAATSHSITDLDHFLDKDQTRNSFDLVLGQGSLATSRADLCATLNELMLLHEKLVSHRNQ